ncbi:universal stress protein [Mycobacterium sp. NAZ190054]|uniref:universal stress protein n=1 Tax=Mycobacterium sp. NAZ190054 TaxID=1747766 RepID=UPI000798EEC3|nr:universal stress protein [Mycobacterium sp. NAZ190054]KWX56549.1 hypothetical protein ASJ79_14195 [Mycobacterium sp. NAZ190054]
MPQHHPVGGVVVGVDGSEYSHAAQRWATRDAELRAVALTTVHVDGEQAGPAEPSGARDTDVVHLPGRPVPVLVELSGQAQLLVVGRHGRGEGRRKVLGSVSVGVLHHARCPVAVIHHEDGREHPRRPVLVAVDGSRTSSQAAAIAFEEASRRGVDLLALHVCKQGERRDLYGPGTDELQIDAERFLADTLAELRQRHPGVPVHLLVRFENPAGQILVQAERAQLVVLGSHGRGNVAGTLLGSVSTAVVDDSRIPVLVARRR